jgi:hypothetical protein
VDWLVGFYSTVLLPSVSEALSPSVSDALLSSVSDASSPWCFITVVSARLQTIIFVAFSFRRCDFVPCDFVPCDFVQIVLVL